MSLFHILVLGVGTGLAGWLARGRSRGWVLLTGSILAIYWLQPSTPVRNLDFWLPTATVGLAALAWAFTRPSSQPLSRQDWLTILITCGVILAISALRYVGPLCYLTPTRPPALLQVLLAIFGYTLIFFVVRWIPGKSGWLYGFFSFILLLFLILKTDAFAQAASAGLRLLVGQDAALATPFDIRWLGFSYTSFRLLHTLRDRYAGRLAEFSLQEYLVYIIFFPAFTAGPIDRIQHFAQDLRQPYRISPNDLWQGGQRILTGIFRKFVLADTLALVALNATNAAQIQSAGWLWVLLYAYALRIYLDFSGYTDIAIGLGRLLGFHLPENFEHPYRKQNLTLFWNSWHITLAQWFRAYYFNPLTRALRTGRRRLSLPLIILIGQITTMLLIGLWHGFTWNFAIWGLWHGLGLFAHNRWSEFVRPHLAGAEHPSHLQRILQISGILLTFHYVTLGWVWFALPSVDLSLKTLLGLFGVEI